MMNKQFRTFLVYPDGSVHPALIFDTAELMHKTVRALARKPCVRYMCEEWTVNTIGADGVEKVAEYEL